MRTVEVYRLWGNWSWDKIPIQINCEEGDSDEIIESRAVTAAWLQLINSKQKPVQIGLYMLSIYGSERE